MTKEICVYGILSICVMCACPAVNAQQPDSTESAKQDSSKNSQPPSTPPEQGGGTNQDEAGKTGDRIFGVLPNYTTVEGAKVIVPVSTKEKFHMAAVDSFDPPVFPFVAFTTWFGQIQGEESSWGRGPVVYAKRYATTFSDDVVATFMTTGVMPTLLHQDPRYFELGEGSRWHRMAYATSRSFVTRGRSGHSQFNYSDVTGNFIAAALSNLYHPGEDRSWSETLGRWGTQMMWDVLSDDLKEFWPDIRRKIRKP